jgi:hypothetical protein
LAGWDSPLLGSNGWAADCGLEITPQEQSDAKHQADPCARSREEPP